MTKSTYNWRSDSIYSTRLILQDEGKLNSVMNISMIVKTISNYELLGKEISPKLLIVDLEQFVTFKSILASLLA